MGTGTYVSVRPLIRSGTGNREAHATCKPNARRKRLRFNGRCKSYVHPLLTAAFGRNGAECSAVPCLKMMRLRDRARRFAAAGLHGCGAAALIGCTHIPEGQRAV